MAYSEYIVEILLMTVLFSILGLLIESWMDSQGLAPSDKIASIISIFLLVSIKTIFFHAASWVLWGIALVLAMIFAVHRGDLWITLKRGRWWWKSGNNSKPE